jgi:hypothetical protein
MAEDENEHGEYVYRIVLRVGVQHFALEHTTDKASAEWYAGMLRTALRKAGATCTE